MRLTHCDADKFKFLINNLKICKHCADIVAIMIYGISNFKNDDIKNKNHRFLKSSIVFKMMIFSKFVFGVVTFIISSNKYKIMVDHTKENNFLKHS